MNPRTTGILFLVAALLGVGIWFSNRHELEKKEAEDQAKKLFGELTAEQVEWIALRTSDGKDARLERSDGAWHLAAPVEFPADAATADGFASALAGLVSESVIEDAQAFAVYGLDADEKTIRFRANGADHELRVGKKTPIGANNYAATGAGGKVYAIASYRATSFEKPLDDLRERRPLRFDRDGVARIEATWRGGGVTLEKKDGVWRLTAPLEAEADAETVETLLSDLVFLRASSFLDTPPPDAEVGLDTPAYRVVLVDAPQEGKQPMRHELAIGGARDGQLRVARGAEAALYQVPGERYEKLPKTVVAFRHKTLASFIATDAQRFELSFADPDAEGASQVVTIEGTSSDGGEGWTTKPDALNEGLAARLVAEVARLKAKDIAADSMGPDELAGVGLAPPRAMLRVFGKPAAEGGEAPELASLLFGVVQGGKIYAKVASRPTVYVLSNTLAEHVPMSLETYRSRFVAPPEAADAPAPAPAEAPTPGPADGGGVPGEELE